MTPKSRLDEIKAAVQENKQRFELQKAKYALQQKHLSSVAITFSDQVNAPMIALVDDIKRALYDQTK